jgi:RHS repeat-associated protein
MTSSYRESNEIFDAAGNLKIRTIQDSAGTMTCSYGYDDLNQLTLIDGVNSQAFIYDSLSNPAVRNKLPCEVNSLNQLTKIGNCSYQYDLNGNRIVKETAQKKVLYEYDALDRLIIVADQVQKTVYDYDDSHRRLAKTVFSWNGTTWLPEQKVYYLYQGSHEIGSYDREGRNIELRVLGQSSFGSEIGAAVALEVGKESYALISDSTGNIVGLIKANDGSPYETYRYSPFGDEQIFDKLGNLVEEAINPWRYASKRKDPETGFIYFGRRYYDPEIGRWLTTDPAGFADGMNLYVFNHNNPLRYIDQDGRFAFAIPLIMVAFGTEVVITTTTISAIAGAFVGAALAYGAYEGLKYLDQQISESSHDYALANQAVEEAVEEKEKKGRRRGKDNEMKGGPPRDPKTADYLPDPAAEGSPHTTFGTREGRKGPFTQGATFDEKGKFKGRIDVTDHGRRDHPNLHYHHETGPNSARTDAEPIQMHF